MQVTRLLEKGLQKNQQNHRDAIINNIENYAASLRRALKDGNSKASITAHVMVEIEECMRKQVNWTLIKCKKGCANCCHVNVAICEGEAALIVDYCKQKEIEINKEVLRIQLNLNNTERPLHDHSKCVFLGKDNSCSIYDVRPLNCRKHLSLTDPKFCDGKKYINGNVVVNFELNTEIIVSAYSNLGMTEGSMAEMLLNKLEEY